MRCVESVQGLGGHVVIGVVLGSRDEVDVRIYVLVCDFQFPSEQLSGYNKLGMYCKENGIRLCFTKLQSVSIPNLDWNVDQFLRH